MWWPPDKNIFSSGTSGAPYKEASTCAAAPVFFLRLRYVYLLAGTCQLPGNRINCTSDIRKFTSGVVDVAKVILWTKALLK